MQWPTFYYLFSIIGYLFIRDDILIFVGVFIFFPFVVSHLDPFGPIYNHLHLFGPIWTYSDTFEHIWIH